MQNGVTKLGLYGLLLSVMPGCWRAVDWAKSNFYQVIVLDQQSIPVDLYIKSVRIHDQLSLRATFDALWLSDEIRAAYVDLYTMRYGKSEEQRKELLRSQLEESKRYISL